MLMRNRCKRNPLVGVLAGALWLSLSLAQAVAATSFAGGKITLAINSAPGGGYDAFGRLVARHLGRFLPGNPTILPQNMPGGGGLIAANWLYNAAPRDGSAIGIIASSAIFAPFLGTSQAKFDPAKFNYLASLANYHGVGLVLRDAPAKSAQDLLTKTLTVGAAGQGSDMTIWPSLLKSIVGAKLELIRGYNGAAAVYLAMERNEVQSIFGVDWVNFKAEKPAWLRDGKVRPILQLSSKRSPDLPNVPTVLELVSGQKRAVLNLFIAREVYSRPFLAPPGVPTAVVAELRKAFDAMTKDPKFLGDARKLHLPIDVTPGAEMEEVVDQVLASPRPVVDAAIKELNEPRHH